MRFARFVVLTSVVSTFAGSALLAVDGDKAQYVGGTLAALKEESEGAPLSIPYASIQSLEYGQKAGRRVAVAVMVSPLALFSKKRNHYLTITYKDASGTEQAASSNWARTSCGRP